MRKIVITVFILITSLSISQAQYNDAIGLRGGLGSGITYKHFISNSTALEGILYTRWSGFGVAALMEHHKELASGPDFRWYYGYGAHIGFYEGRYVYWGSESSYMVMGIDGIIGLEYNIPDLPINLSIDWKPAFNLIGYSGFFADAGAFSIRYTF